MCMYSCSVWNTDCHLLDFFTFICDQFVSGSKGIYILLDVLRFVRHGDDDSALDSFRTLDKFI